jgi:hypothetical protein
VQTSCAKYKISFLKLDLGSDGESPKASFWIGKLNQCTVLISFVYFFTAPPLDPDETHEDLVGMAASGLPGRHIHNLIRDSLLF